ncbi:MAG: hypothetical protein EKK29_13835 [Hyphomicrobiales bacterium]|nr:MAG: hypothetical protein EKK29_13835 [Hyphomicrobiales bacterium]
MSAARALDWLHSHGVTVELDGGSLRLTGDTDLSPAIVARIRELKPLIVAELSRPLFDPDRLQAEADRKNAQAIREGRTDRFCRCGHLAEAERIIDNRPTWRCDECRR